MIRCGHCKGDHATVADVRACAIDSGALTGEANDGLPVLIADEPVRVRFLDQAPTYMDATNPLALTDLRWSKP